MKTIFYVEDYKSQGTQGDRKRVVLNDNEANEFLNKPRSRWFQIFWVGDGDVSAIPKCIVQRVFCPGETGPTTTTSWEVREVHQWGCDNPNNWLWTGQTEFYGKLIEQVYHSPSRYGGDFRYEDPYIAPDAPEWLVQIGIQLAKDDWRTDFKKRFP